MDRLINEALQYDNIIIGESSHGAHEFAVSKFNICKRLLSKVSFIAVEWDWCDCYRINQYVTHQVPNLIFKMSRWPEFLWQNQETYDFIEYLRQYNSKAKYMVQFYGLDVFGVNDCLKQLGISTNQCSDDDNSQHISSICMRYIDTIKSASKSRDLNQVICSKVIKNYKLMNRLGASTSDKWNAREMHMVDVYKTLRNKYGGIGVILCHNSHAQHKSCVGMETLGSYIPNSYVIAMICYDGSILTADTWGGELKKRNINPPKPSAIEVDVFDNTNQTKFIVFESQIPNGKHEYRALGAVCDTDGYYFNGSLKCSFDALICIRKISPIRYV